jgi:hypothetical protein
MLIDFSQYTKEHKLPKRYTRFGSFFLERQSFYHKILLSENAFIRKSIPVFTL